MLFYITSSLVTKLKANPTDSAIIEAINNLAFSRKHGYHLLAAEYEDLKFLKECKQLQPFTQSVFNQLFHTWAEIGSLKERFKFQVEIVAEPEILQIKKEEDKEIIELSIDYIQEFEILNKTKIIAENQKEIEFYLYISKLYKNDKRFSAIPSKYSPLMGGGDTTAKVYDTEQNNKNSFCICFADKDIKYPNCKVGATLKKLQDVDNKTNPLCKLIPIDVREIENLIPLKLLKIAHENSK